MYQILNVIICIMLSYYLLIKYGNICKEVIYKIIIRVVVYLLLHLLLEIEIDIDNIVTLY